MPGLNVGGEDSAAPQLNRPNRSKQFGIGSLLTVTAMYAFLFGGWRAESLDPVEFAVITGAFTAILIGRFLLFGGRRPLTASVIVGVCLAQVLCTWVLLFGFDNSFRSLFFVTFEYVGLAIVGAGLGLLTGCAMGFFYLVARAVSWGLSLIVHLADRRSGGRANGVKEANGPCPLPLHMAVVTRLGSSVPVCFRRRPSRTFIVLVAATIAITIFRRRPLLIAFHRSAMESSLAACTSNKSLPPMFRMFHHNCAYPEYNDYAFGAYQNSRDRLAELGYLVRREFSFENVSPGSRAGNLIFKRALAAFPLNQHTRSPCFEPEQPFHLRIWDRPSQIPLWEQFVKTQDVPMVDIEPEAEQDGTADTEKSEEEHAPPPADSATTF